MSTLNLDHLFQARTMALVGASPRPGKPGEVLARHLTPCLGPEHLYLVNPKHTRLHGREVLPSVDALPRNIDLALLCTPAATLPDLVSRLGQRGCRSAVILSAGLQGIERIRALLNAARPFGLRLLGPGSLGLLMPGRGLNASFSPVAALPGRLALVSQSGAMMSSVLDWARSRDIGFSYLISLGQSADVDLSDCIDWLANDGDTDAILLYVEAVRGARKFMTAARATARHKPLVVVKGGRLRESALAAASHSGAPAEADEVFDAAVRRAGMLRVYSTSELFDAVETLARGRPARGRRLAILSNGGGPGVVATDELLLRGGELAELSSNTLAALDNLLPRSWSRANPVDLSADADAGRYARVARQLLAAPEVDAVLSICAPTPVGDPADIARALARELRGTPRALFTCWMGGGSLESARRACREHGLASYDSPQSAVRALLHQVEYRRNQRLLMQTPAYRALDRQPQPAEARSSLRSALIAGRQRLSEPESKAILQAYGIPVVPTAACADGAQVLDAAAAMGYPVVLKVVSPDIVHKSDVGGVVLDLADASELRAALAGVRQSLERNAPRARLSGFTVQKMVRRAGAFELLIAVRLDRVFGPVLVFGQGGNDAGQAADRAVALPPLNATLARDLIEHSQAGRRMSALGLELAPLEALLTRISQLLIDCPEIAELEINPLIYGGPNMSALDARIRVATPVLDGQARLAIRPYPQELEERVRLPDGERVMLRAIRPEDEPAHRDFLGRIAEHDLYLRFFSAAKQFDHERLARLTQVDYDREMAFLAVREPAETLAVVRAVSNSEATQAEFAVLVRSDQKRRGLARLLMNKLIDYARERGLARLTGEVLPENHAMLALARSLGFQVVARDEDGTLHMCLGLLPRG